MLRSLAGNRSVRNKHSEPSWCKTRQLFALARLQELLQHRYLPKCPSPALLRSAREMPVLVLAGVGSHHPEPYSWQARPLDRDY